MTTMSEREPTKANFEYANSSVDPEMLHAQEIELIHSAQAGDSESFGELYRRHADAIHGRMQAWNSNGYSEDAADITSETFLKALKSIDSFNAAEATPGKFRGWLFRIAWNTSNTQHTRRKRISIGTIESEESTREFVSNDPLVDDEVTMHVDIKNYLAEKLEDPDVNSDHIKTVIALDLLDMSLMEAASTLDAPKGTIQSRSNRGRQILRAAGPPIGYEAYVQRPDLKSGDIPE